jgi:hypothetical protein
MYQAYYMYSVPTDASPSFRYLSNKFCDVSRNVRCRIRLACWYELEGSVQPSHILLVQGFPLRSPCDTATFLHSG